MGERGALVVGVVSELCQRRVGRGEGDRSALLSRPLLGGEDR